MDFSDHLNYWTLGVKAVMITDTAFYRNKNYHDRTDTPETLNYSKMAEVVKGLAASFYKSKVIDSEHTERSDPAHAAQPATQPADKVPPKDQPSTPTSKDARR